jgi:uncharacterized NAD-dependent epimerase/dehydratase family protein
MDAWPEGNAIIYCEANFRTPNGKTAHGLVRRSERYRVVSVIDSTLVGNDAGEVLDGRRADIPIHPDLATALDDAAQRGTPATHLVIGLAPDGGRLSGSGKDVVAAALRSELNVDSGLHDFLSEDMHLSGLAKEHGVTLRDVRKPPPRNELHFFSGKIEQVAALTIALLGTDSAVGKRTTAWLVVDALRGAGIDTELIGTGQTAWMQGARYSIVLDSLVNDFVSGEIEHAVWHAWQEAKPQVIVLEGQGSLLNPAYPGGFELLAAGRPDAVVLQHAPARRDYDGFPGYPLHPIERQIQAIEVISSAPVIAITINHEGLDGDGVQAACDEINRSTGLPTFDVLSDGANGLLEIIKSRLD